jgi:hypothetical protein
MEKKVAKRITKEMKRSQDERQKKEHTKTLLIRFNTHGGLFQSEKNKCM